MKQYTCLEHWHDIPWYDKRTGEEIAEIKSYMLKIKGMVARKEKEEQKDQGYSNMNTLPKYKKFGTR